MMNVVRTYNLEGNLLYEAAFETAEKAYAEYKGIIENLKKRLPKCYAVMVVRFRNERVMSKETVVGMQ